MTVYRGDVRLYRTENGEIVPEGDERAAFLVIAPGQDYGAVDAPWGDKAREYVKAQASEADADSEQPEATALREPEHKGPARSAARERK